MEFYIATLFERKQDHNKLRDLITQELGHSLTYDWTRCPVGRGEGDLGEVARQEVDAVLECDYMVVLLPGGRGTHGELVAGLITDKPVFIFGPRSLGFMEKDGRTCAFYHHPNVVSVIESDDQNDFSLILDAIREHFSDAEKEKFKDEIYS